MSGHPTEGLGLLLRTDSGERGYRGQTTTLSSLILRFPGDSIGLISHCLSVVIAHELRGDRCSVCGG